VQGVPLGILLAAPWVEMLTPEEIVIEITQSLDFLESGVRDAPERQRSMRAVFDYSWKLLTEREQEVLGALSVFRGDFNRQAAQAVAGASLRELMALMGKSLLRRTTNSSTALPSAALGEGGTGGRYEVAHELLRQHAAERLEDSGKADAVRAAHSAYYAEFLHQREGELRGHRQSRTLGEIEADFENVLAAWAWALQRRDYAIIHRSMEGLRLFCDNWQRQPVFR
jgi:predicted ATPase